MLIVRNPQFQKLMVSRDLIDPIVYESLNRDYGFDFTILLDEEKTKYIQTGNIAEIADDYFRIAHYDKQRQTDGVLFYGVECEHVSYELNDDEYNLEYFASDGTPAYILYDILDGTPFSVGSVMVGGTFTFSIQEETTRRNVLIQFARSIGAELIFHKYTISLVQQRGTDDGKQIRFGKNLEAITIDREITDDGQERISYDIDVTDLEGLPEYQGLESIEIGDTRRIIDSRLNLDVSARVVYYEYDPIRRKNSRVECANFREDFTDDVLSIQRQQVVKDRIYNGIRVGPVHGFEAIRSDNRARTVMNATEGVKIQKGDGSGSNWDDVIYLDLEGNARFTGRIEASEMYGGIIEGAQIRADTTINVGTDLVVGNQIRLGELNAFGKSLVFSSLANISYEEAGLTVTSPVGINLSSGGSTGDVIITAGRRVLIEGGQSVDIDGYVKGYLELILNGTELQVYSSGSYVGSVQLSAG